MNIALIGGVKSLEKNYKLEADKRNIDLRVFNKATTGMALKVRNYNAVIIFTNFVSHRAKKEIMDMAKKSNMPVVMHHSSGVSTLRDSLNCILHNQDNIGICSLYSRT